MDEIAIRKADIDSQLVAAKFFKPDELSKEEQNMLIQYHSVFTVYKPIAGKYKNAVLHAEETFYAIKTLEKSVKDGAYDKKLEEFKSTWNELYKEGMKNLEESTEIATKLNSVEPMYQRLAPKVDELLDRLSR